MKEPIFNVAFTHSTVDPEVIAHMIQQSLTQTALQEALEEAQEAQEGFEVGDVVVLSEIGRETWGCSEGNPSCKGTIKQTDKDSFCELNIVVYWENGFINSYQEEDLELFVEETPETKMIVDLQQIRWAAEYCEAYNPYVDEDADFFEQEIFNVIERYVDGKTCTAIYGFYVLFEKEFDDVVFVNVLVDPRLGMSGEYTEATLKDGILVEGF